MSTRAKFILNFRFRLRNIENENELHSDVGIVVTLFTDEAYFHDFNDKVLSLTRTLLFFIHTGTIPVVRR